jgi:hypothetical protein
MNLAKDQMAKKSFDQMFFWARIIAIDRIETSAKSTITAAKAATSARRIRFATTGRGFPRRLSRGGG